MVYFNTLLPELPSLSGTTGIEHMMDSHGSNNIILFNYVIILW